MTTLGDRYSYYPNLLMRKLILREDKPLTPKVTLQSKGTNSHTELATESKWQGALGDLKK